MPNDVEQSETAVALVASTYEWQCPECDLTRYTDEYDAKAVYCQRCSKLYPVKGVYHATDD